MAQLTLADVADELYGLTPAEFTAARNARARGIKDERDLELAKRVNALRKPSPAAWAVNLLARHSAGELAGLTELGEAMRSAQTELNREQLTELTRQRRALVAALARRAAALASDARHNLTPAAIEEVAQTLQAALGDAAAASAVCSGRLVLPLVASGVEPVDLTDAVAAPEASMISAPRIEPKSAPVRDLATVRAAKEAQKKADEADAAVTSIERRIESLQADRGRAESRLNELEQQLAAIEDELREGDRELRSLTRERERAAQRAADLRAEATALRGEH